MRYMLQYNEYEGRSAKSQSISQRLKSCKAVLSRLTLERVMFAKFLHCDLCKLYGKLLLQAGRQSLDHRQRGAGRAPRLHRQRGAGRVPRLHRQRGAGSLQTTGRRGPAVLQGTTGRGEHAGNFVDTPCPCQCTCSVLGGAAGSRSRAYHILN